MAACGSPFVFLDLGRHRVATELCTIFLEARDHALGATVRDMHDYPPDRILYGMRYQDAITLDGQGRTSVDLTRISAVEPDLCPTAIPRASSTDRAPGGVVRATPMAHSKVSTGR
jgi:hypothetical protein